MVKLRIDVGRLAMRNNGSCVNGDDVAAATRDASTFTRRKVVLVLHSSSGSRGGQRAASVLLTVMKALLWPSM